MKLTKAEIEYLSGQQLGRLATIQADGSPQVKPVGFSYNSELGTVDVTGFGMSGSQKFKNVGRDGRAALVVDDIASVSPWRVRFLEIRGSAEALPSAERGDGQAAGALIRIWPRRVLSFGVEEPPGEPHQTPIRARTVTS
jgi:pyridoxamine 5'-phosphate oxidase family protein